MDELTEYNSEPTEQDLKLAEDAVPVCPHCLEPCDRLQNYCANCGSNEAINPLASYMPYVRIRFNTGMYGKLWRKSWSRNTSRKIRWFCFLVVFLYQPVIFVIGLPFVILDKRQNDKLTKSYAFFSYIWAVVVFLGYILFIIMVNRYFYGY